MSSTKRPQPTRVQPHRACKHRKLGDPPTLECKQQELEDPPALDWCRCYLIRQQMYTPNGRPKLVRVVVQTCDPGSPRCMVNGPQAALFDLVVPAQQGRTFECICQAAEEVTIPDAARLCRERNPRIDHWSTCVCDKALWNTNEEAILNCRDLKPDIDHPTGCHCEAMLGFNLGDEAVRLCQRTNPAAHPVRD